MYGGPPSGSDPVGPPAGLEQDGRDTPFFAAYIRMGPTLALGSARLNVNNLYPDTKRPWFEVRRGGVVVRLLASYLAVPGSISGGDLRMWESCPDDAAGRRVFSGKSRFSRPCIPSLIHTHHVTFQFNKLTLISLPLSLPLFPSRSLTLSNFLLLSPSLSLSPLLTLSLPLSLTLSIYPVSKCRDFSKSLQAHLNSRMWETWRMLPLADGSPHATPVSLTLAFRHCSIFTSSVSPAPETQLLSKAGLTTTRFNPSVALPSAGHRAAVPTRRWRVVCSGNMIRRAARVSSPNCRNNTSLAPSVENLAQQYPLSSLETRLYGQAGRRRTSISLNNSPRDSATYWIRYRSHMYKKFCIS
ncbi:hypothetical protein PR048_022731 [Dryococelus australis]|uniref:Uncharacterized protein n=1 Tax=Dryococelus australis TaxID=614101 RepID=A0ABQ9GS40_9NEOP|nr:hypothetical protein PR048_022731 [Dryococelus australis]